MRTKLFMPVGGSSTSSGISAGVAGSMTESVDTTNGNFGQIIGTMSENNKLLFLPNIMVLEY